MPPDRTRGLGRAIGRRLLCLLLTVLLAAALVLAAGLARKRLVDLTAAGLTGGLLCLPAAVIALAALHAGLGPAPAIAIVLLPRLFRYMRNATAAIAGRPHVLAARARG